MVEKLEGRRNTTPPHFAKFFLFRTEKLQQRGGLIAEVNENFKNLVLRLSFTAHKTKNAIKYYWDTQKT